MSLFTSALLDRCDALKQEGNALFMKGEAAASAVKYTEAAVLLTPELSALSLDDLETVAVPQTVMSALCTTNSTSSSSQDVAPKCLSELLAFAGKQYGAGAGAKADTDAVASPELRPRAVQIAVACHSNHAQALLSELAAATPTTRSGAKMTPTHAKLGIDPTVPEFLPKEKDARIVKATFAAAAATRALTICRWCESVDRVPANLVPKAGVRLVTALLEAERPFAALVAAVSPMVTISQASSEALAPELVAKTKEIGARPPITSQLRRQMMKACDITDVHDGFGLASFGSGVTAVATESMKADDRVFLETELESEVAAVIPQGDKDESATTAGQVRSYIDQMLQLIAEEAELRDQSSDSPPPAAEKNTDGAAGKDDDDDDDKTGAASELAKKKNAAQRGIDESDTLKGMEASLAGCWPRSLTDVDAATLAPLVPLVKAQIAQFVSKTRTANVNDIVEALNKEMGWSYDGPSASAKAKAAIESATKPDASSESKPATATEENAQKTSTACVAENGDSSITSVDSLSVFERRVFHVALKCRYNCFHAGFFRACALLNHSCKPNAAMKHIPSKRGIMGGGTGLQGLLGNLDSPGTPAQVNLVTVCPVTAGDMLTVKYFSDFDFLLGVGFRRFLLHASWLFVCGCSRCMSDVSAESCESEWTRCPNCAADADIVAKSEAQPQDASVFFPFPPSIATSDELEIGSTKAKTPESENEGGAVYGTCTTCGHSLTTDQREAIATSAAAAQASCSAIATGEVNTGDVNATHSALLAIRSDIGSWASDDHWMHRLALYVECVKSVQAVDGTFRLFQDGKATLSEACRRVGADEFSWIGSDEISAPDGSVSYTFGILAPVPLLPDVDLLGAFLDLWRRIEDFYPAGQAWSLHMCISQLATLAVGAATFALQALSEKQQQESAKCESSDEATAGVTKGEKQMAEARVDIVASVLIDHAKFVGPQQRQRLWACLQTCGAGKALPAKVQKALKKELGK